MWFLDMTFIGNETKDFNTCGETDKRETEETAEVIKFHVIA